MRALSTLLVFESLLLLLRTEKKKVVVVCPVVCFPSTKNEGSCIRTSILLKELLDDANLENLFSQSPYKQTRRSHAGRTQGRDDVFFMRCYFRNTKFHSNLCHSNTCSNQWEPNDKPILVVVPTLWWPADWNFMFPIKQTSEYHLPITYILDDQESQSE